MLKAAGHDPEQLKGGKATGRLDLFTDDSGRIFICPKDGSGPGEDTGLSLHAI